MVLALPLAATILLWRPKLSHGFGRASDLPISSAVVLSHRLVIPLPGYGISPLAECLEEVTPVLY